MRFEATPLDGAVVVGLDRVADDRGSFARTFCEDEFAAHGLPTRFPQSNLSTNRRAGTLRGMHLNTVGHTEAKLVRCVRGAVHDVVVDLRPASPTYLRWFGLRLDPDEGRALFVPEGFAHGFVTLEDDTDVTYLMSRPFEAGVGIGFRWDDPAFGIEWPVAPTVMNERDRTYPDFDPALLHG